MSKYVNTVVTLIVTFVVTLALNASSNYFASEKGTLNISRPLTVGGKIQYVVSIENYSSRFINGIILEIPAGISQENVSSDSSIKLEDFEKGTAERAGSLKINQISPRRTTTIVLVGTRDSMTQSVHALNTSESGLALQQDDELISPVSRALKEAILVSIIQAVSVAIGAYYLSGSHKKLSNAAEELKKNLDDTNTKIRELREASTKIKILLLGKISDYSKELDFWRNLIKESLGRESLRTGDAEKIFEHVRKSLKTYGATHMMHDLDEIKIAASWLREDERKFDQQQKV
ncbi:hypothetical protein [Caballeronia sp. GAFFF3]|uniref:hypothetical protein n=1 Tax=Caballeronia sp. GAFFF3 TaxID=2921759 RepID=UPI0020289EC0|nr:hypothetical protein [Caballeronia sp. GAFFF3]